jgi:hypothetical protein
MPLSVYASLPLKCIGDRPKTVGWGGERNWRWRESAASYFKDLPESWAILPIDPYTTKKEVQKYVDGVPELKLSKIILVSTRAMEGDFTSAKFTVVHDIIGHGIYEGLPKGTMVTDSTILHQALPKRFQISTAYSDFAPDILAALFFQVDIQEVVERISQPFFEEHLVCLEAERQKYLKELKTLQQEVQRWAAKFKPGVPRKVILWR